MKINDLWARMLSARRLGDYVLVDLHADHLTLCMEGGKRPPKALSHIDDRQFIQRLATKWAANEVRRWTTQSAKSRYSIFAYLRTDTVIGRPDVQTQWNEMLGRYNYRQDLKVAAKNAESLIEKIEASEASPRSFELLADDDVMQVEFAKYICQEVLMSWDSEQRMTIC